MLVVAPPLRRPARAPRGAALRAVLALAAGALLAVTVLVAWSCRVSSPLGSRPLIDPLPSERSVVDTSEAARATVRDEPLVRVRIAAGVEQAELSSRAYWVVAPAGAREGEAIPGPARIVASNGGVKLFDARGRLHGFAPGETVVASVYTTAGPAGSGEVNGAAYPGRFMIVPEPDGDPSRFDIVNLVGIESYLPGVLSRELYAHWHLSAFSVQAVAARTFALDRREQSRRSGRHFDLESTTRDQAYGGLSSLPVAIEAVRATRGIVLIERDGIAPAYYSSTCGGRPALAEEIWPSNAPRDVHVALGSAGATPDAQRDTLCNAAPLYTWEVLRDTDELAARIRAWGVDAGQNQFASLGGLDSVEPIAWSATKRPIRYALLWQGGVRTELTGEQLRVAANYPGDRLPPVGNAARVHSNDLEVEVGRLVTRISGRGHGHGVGMCQFCAQSMALRGDHWRQMLAAFYPDADLRRVY